MHLFFFLPKRISNFE